MNHIILENKLDEGVAIDVGTIDRKCHQIPDHEIGAAEIIHCHL
jgi:hypothetical protein